jgi:hypothetical protein
VTPKDKRDRLFKRSKPFIRPLVIRDGDKYHKDMGYLWVSHQRKPFHVIPKDITQSEFARRIEHLASCNEFFMVDDDSHELKGRGPIALVGITTDGWKIEPHVEFMQWASPRNKLRGCVTFFQMMMLSRKVGACVVYCVEDSRCLFDHVCHYGVLQYVGKILNGDPRGDNFIYSMRGRNGRHV